MYRLRRIELAAASVIVFLGCGEAVRRRTDRAGAPADTQRGGLPHSAS